MRASVKGFSLIEVLVAVLLIGLAIAGLLGANRAYTMANGVGLELTESQFLIEQIRELTMTLPVADPQTGTSTFGPETGETLAAYDDLDDLDGACFDPPIDAARNELAHMEGFMQAIAVFNVDANDFDLVVGDHGSNFVKVEVTVFKSGRSINSATWLRSRY